MHKRRGFYSDVLLLFWHLFFVATTLNGVCSGVNNTVITDYFSKVQSIIPENGIYKWFLTV